MIIFYEQVINVRTVDCMALHRYVATYMHAKKSYFIVQWKLFCHHGKSKNLNMKVSS